MVPKHKLKVARDLRDNLKGLYSVYEEHAKKCTKGLAGIMHAALTGVDCIESVKRARTSCLALQKTENQQSGARRGGSGGSRGRGGSGGGRMPDRNRDMSNVQCHKCYGYGHYQSTCRRKQGNEPKAIMPS